MQIPFLQPWNFGVLTTSIPCPICPDGSLDIPWLYLVFCYLLIIGMSNAVNLTDGLDGLAAGTVMVVMIVMAAIAYRENMLPMAVFAATMAGACVGFLWFNAYPADIFMGDTGSLALGSALAPYGAFAPPLREKGLERNEGRHSILDRFGRACRFRLRAVLHSAHCHGHGRLNADGKG